MLALRLHVDGYSVSEQIDREGFDAETIAGTNV